MHGVKIMQLKMLGMMGIRRGQVAAAQQALFQSERFAFDCCGLSQAKHLDGGWIHQWHV